jgi:hypothetical protein
MQLAREELLDGALNRIAAAVVSPGALAKATATALADATANVSDTAPKEGEEEVAGTSSSADRAKKGQMKKPLHFYLRNSAVNFDRFCKWVAPPQPIGVLLSRLLSILHEVNRNHVHSSCRLFLYLTLLLPFVF